MCVYDYLYISEFVFTYNLAHMAWQRFLWCTNFVLSAFLVSVFCAYAVCCGYSRDFSFFMNMRFLIAVCLFINTHKFIWKKARSLSALSGSELVQVSV